MCFHGAVVKIPLSSMCPHPPPPVRLQRVVGLPTLPQASQVAIDRQVFCYTGDAAHEEMQQACFDYLRLGGWYSAGPISLLSGLRPSPSVLVMHFFAVAIFGVGRLLLPRPTFR